MPKKYSPTDDLQEPHPIPADDKQPTPAKQAGPQHAEAEHAEEQAAAALDELHPDATPAERARKVKRMQRKVGNRRLAKMLAAGSNSAPAKAPADR